MARLTDANHASNRDLHQFAWDSRQDARLVKFLSELAMIFLPITAVAVSPTIASVLLHHTNSLLIE